MKFRAIIAITIFIPFFAIADGGVFGTKWGSTVDELKSNGAVIIKKKDDGRLSIYSATSLPKNISIAETYQIIFHHGHGLQKIQMISKDISNDPSGMEGKSLYAKLKDGLINKYGQPGVERESTGNKLFEEDDEFYQCLAYAGCGAWIAFFKIPPNANVAIELKGLKRGKGYITLTYEGPKWDGIVDENRRNKAISDSSAL